MLKGEDVLSLKPPRCCRRGLNYLLEEELKRIRGVKKETSNTETKFEGKGRKRQSSVPHRPPAERLPRAPRVRGCPGAGCGAGIPPAPTAMRAAPASWRAAGLPGTARRGGADTWPRLGRGREPAAAAMWAGGAGKRCPHGRGRRQECAGVRRRARLPGPAARRHEEGWRRGAVLVQVRLRRSPDELGRLSREPLRSSWGCSCDVPDSGREISEMLEGRRAPGRWVLGGGGKPPMGEVWNCYESRGGKDLSNLFLACSQLFKHAVETKARFIKVFQPGCLYCW